MKKLLSRFWKEEEGMGTVEIVIIIAVLVAVALLFRKYIIQFIQSALSGIFGADGQGTGIDTGTNLPGPGAGGGGGG